MTVAQSADAVPAPGGAAIKLTLRQALEVALDHSRTLGRAGLQREIERFDLRVAEDEFRPNLDILSTARLNPVRTDGARTTTEAASVSAALSQRVPTGARVALVWDNRATDVSTQTHPHYQSGLALTVEQPLLRGAGPDVALAGLRIARLIARDGEAAFRRTVINTLTNVILAYRSLAFAQASLEISDRALERAREQLRINRALVSSGILPPVEIVQTEADIANQELNVLAARSALESARFALVRLLDIERALPLEATERFDSPPFELDLATCLELAYRHRPDYQQVLRARDIAQQTVVLARSNDRWSLGLSSSYRLTGAAPSYATALDRSLSRENDDWLVGITLQVPIGDLSRRQAHVRARLRLRQVDLDVDELTENVQIEVRDSLRRIELARERVRVAAVARELAERKLEIEKGKLQTGRTTNFAVVTFQNDLVRARLGELAAQADYLNGLTVLDQVLGITLMQWGVSVIDLDADGPARAFLAAR